MLCRHSIASSGASLAQPVTTVLCDLIGGTSVTQAICTGISAGPGNGSQTTTLGSSQISYYPITVTAGPGSNPTGSPSGSATASAGASSTADTSAAAAANTNGATAIAVSYGGAILAGLGAMALL
jgi:hypothetical protein